MVTHLAHFSGQRNICPPPRRKKAWKTGLVKKVVNRGQRFRRKSGKIAVKTDSRIINKGAGAWQSNGSKRRIRDSAITNIQPGDMERNKTDTTPSASKLQARITVMVSAGGRTGYRRKPKRMIPVLGHFPLKTITALHLEKLKKTMADKVAVSPSTTPVCGFVFISAATAMQAG